MAINGGRINFQVGYTLDKSGLAEIQSSLNQLTITAKMPSNQFNAEMQKSAQTARQVEAALQKAYNVQLGAINVSKFNKELEKTGLDLKTIQRDFTSFGASGQIAWEKLGSSLLNTKIQLRDTNTLLDRMAQTMAGTVKWGITSRIFNNITNSISDSFHYVKELDSSLNDIRIVTDKSADSMKEFAKQANEAAKALGASTRDYTEASLIYFQQGLGDVETAARAETTLKAANVTGQSADEVSEQLTAVWNGYKVSADEAELYVDKLSAVAATTAADLEELSTGMSKVASAANLMGVDIDQLNAQLATIVSVTRQAPESVGTALKTIYARMGDIEAGLDTEVTLGEYTSQMAAMGVNVLDANDKLRDMGDVIEEIGGKWTTLSREQQVALSQIMAGTRQYNNLLSLFDNWSMYTDAIETSTNAIGTLNKQNDIYLESTKAKLQQLRTTMEGVYGELIGSDDINNLVDAMTDLAQVAENFIGSFGGGLKSISIISLLIANIFNKQLSQGLVNITQKQAKYNQNVDALKAKVQLIQQGQVKNFAADSIQAQAVITGYNKEIELATRINSIRAGLTNEEYNHLTQMQQEIGLLEQEKILIEENAKKQLESNKYLTDKQAKQIYGMAFGSEEDANKLVEQQQDIQTKISGIEDKQVSRENDLKAAQDELRINKEILKTKENSLKFVNGKYELNGKIYKSKAQALKYEKSQVRQASDELLLIEKKYKKEQKNIVNEKEELEILKAQNKAIEEALNLSQQRDQIESQQQALMISFNTSAQIAAKAAQIQNTVTKVTSSVSTLAMAWGSMSSLMNTWQDEEASFGDKMLQTIMTLSFTLPMVTSSFGKLTEAMGIQGGVIASLTALSAKRSATATMEAIATKAQILAIKQEIATRGLNLTAMTQEELAIVATTIATTANIGVTEAQTAAVINATIAQNAWNVSLLANPIILIGMALVGLIATLAIYANKQEKLAEQEKKIREEKLALIDTVKTENEKIVSLTSSYQELYETYQKTGKGQEELRTKQEEIIEGLGKEGEALKGLIGNYELYNQKLKQIQLEKISEQKKDISEGIDVAEQNLLNGASQNIVLGWHQATLNTIRDMASTDEKEAEKWKTFNIVDSAELWKQDERDYYNFNANYVTNGEIDIEALLEQYDKTGEVLEELKEEGLDNNEIYEDINNWYIKLTDSVTKYRQALETLSGLSAQELLILEEPPKILHQTDYEKYKQQVIDQFKLNEEIMKAAKASKEGEEAYLETLFDTAISQYGSLDAKRQNQLENEREGLIEGYKSNTFVSDKIKEQVEQGTKYTFDGEIREKVSQGIEDNANAQLEKLAQYVQDKGLSSIFTGAELTREDWNKFFNANGSQAAIEEIVAKNKEYLKEQFEKNQAGVASDLSFSLFSEAQSGDLTIENITDNENWTALENQLETIKTLYPELRGEVETLNNTAIVGSQSWISALGAIQDAMSQLSLSSKAKEIEEEIKDIDITLDTKDFEKELDDVLDLKRELVIEVRAETTQEFNEMVNGMNSLTEAASKISDDFKVSTEDIYALGQAFPEIYENAEYLADGTIKLNSEVVKSSMATAQAEITDDYRKTIAKLKNKKADVDANIKLYENLVQIATDAAADEKKIDKAKADIKAGLDNEIQLSDINTTNVELENIDAVAKSEASMYETSVINADKAAREKVKISKVEAEAKRHNALYGEGQESSTVDYTYEVKYKGEVADIFDATTVNETKIDDIKTTDEMKDMASGLNQYLAALREYSDELGIEITAADSEYLQSMFQLKGAGSGLGTDNKKDGSNKDKEILDEIKDERDVYLEINQQLEAMEAHMSSLETANEKLFGQSKIDNYKKQIENLDKQIELSQEKIKISAKEVARYQKALEKDGLTFDKEGMLTNYDEWYKAEKKEINELIDEYNELSATEQESKKGKKLKDKIEDKKANFEESQDWIDSYLDSYQQEMEDTNAIAEAEAEKVSKYIESLDYEIQLKVDDSELQNAYEDFQQNLMSEDNFEGKASSLARQYQNIVNSGQLEARNAQIEETKKAIQTIEKGGTDENFGTDLEQAREHLKTLIEEQISNYEQLQELNVSIAENWGDSLDQMSEDMEDIQTEFDNLSSKAEHYANLTKLFFGDEDYIKQKQFFQNQDDINRARLNTLQQDLKVWEEQRKKTEVLYDQAIKNGNMAMADTYKETMDSLDDTIQETTESIQSTLEETLENIADEFENAIKSATQKAEETLSGGLGFDVISDGLSKAKQYSDDWLDDVQEIYEINKLTREFDNAAAAASTASAQQKILAIKQKELAILEKQDKLSQYDLDRANAQFNLTLKQIALEEAQQNKSKMVLKRDAQGNYSYQYSADQEQISKAQQDVADAELKVNELDQDRYFQLAQGLTELNRSMLEDMEKANIEYANDENARQQALLQIEDYYNKEKANLKEDLGIVEEHLMDSSFAYFKSLYDIDALNWKSMTDTEKETYKTFIFGEEGLVPIATSGFNKIKAILTGEEDSFDITFVETMNTCQTALDTYKTKVNEVATAVGGDFYKIVHGEGDSVGLIDTQKETQNLIDKNGELITSYTGEDGVLPAIEAICTELGNQETAHLAVKDAMDLQINSGTQLLRKMKGISEEAENAKKKLDNLAKAGNNVPKHSGSNNNNNNNNSDESNPANLGKNEKIEPTNIPENKSVKLYDYDTFELKREITKPSLWTFYPRKTGKDTESDTELGGMKYKHINTAQKFDKNGKLIEIVYNTWMDFNTWKKIKGFDTGGYTGSWNSSNGKMAMLHEKELVLNKEDTRNILSAVNSVRMIDSIISSLEHSMKSRVFGLMMDSYSQAKGYTREDKGFEQHVQINASFPDATDHNEIEIALNNLMNRASQLAWSDNR